jgi:hypothetical protein
MGSSTVGVGQDYSTLIAWEAAKQADITGLGPEIANCFGEIDHAGSTCTISGWTTTAADYVHIRADPTEDKIVGRSVLHATSPGTHPYITYTGASTNFTLGENYVDFEGLEMTPGSNGNTTPIAFGTPTTEQIVHIIGCLIAMPAATFGACVSASDAQSVIHLWNCIFMSANRAMVLSGNHADSTVVNCTSFGSSANINLNISGTTHNSYAAIGSTASHHGSSGGGDYNASDDTSAETEFTNSHNSLAPADQFTLPTEVMTTFDFSLKATSALIGEGLANVNTALDMQGQTRDNPPAIGALEVLVVAAGSGPTGSADGLYRQSAFHDGIISDNGGPWTDCHVTDFRRALCIAASIADYNSVSVEDAWKRYTEL